MRVPNESDTAGTIKLETTIPTDHPITSVRVQPVPGTVDAAKLAKRCAERDEIGFLFHPPSPDQVRAVSDAGQVMPRKATWFDPKARTGPFLRDLDA